MKKCTTCHKNDAGGVRRIEFIYHGLKLHAFMDSFICRECLIEKISKLISESVSKGIFTIVKKGEESELKVNWEIFANLRDNTMEYVVDLMFDAGILISKPAPAFVVIGHGTVLEPSNRLSDVFFARKEDAIGYVRTVYGGALYPILILPIGDMVIWKENGRP